MMGTPPLSALLRGSSVRRSHFVTKDLPCFTPGTENFFVTDIRKNKGSNVDLGCGASSRRRTTTAAGTWSPCSEAAEEPHPDAADVVCSSQLDTGIGSTRRFRHSEIDWSHHQQARQAFSPESAGAIDTVLREG